MLGFSHTQTHVSISVFFANMKVDPKLFVKLVMFDRFNKFLLIPGKRIYIFNIVIRHIKYR